MEIVKILKFIQKEIPGYAAELWSSLDLLHNALKNSRASIDGAIGKLSSNRDFDKASEFMGASKDLAEIIDIINAYTKEYTHDIEDSSGIVVEDDEDENNNYKVAGIIEKIDYEKYRVNEDVAYNIYTNFTHKKPAGFSLDGVKYPARLWKLVLTKTCELLSERNYAIFNSFTHDMEMQGRKRTYFSNNDEGIVKPIKVQGTEIFVETNLSANNIRNIVINMLDKYNISKNRYQIFLSKDLTPIHEKKTSIECGIDEIELENSVKNYDQERSIDDKKALDILLNTEQAENSKNRLVLMAEQDNIIKSQCFHFDFKKDVCMCEKAPCFIQRCNAVYSCQYFENKNLDEPENIVDYNIKKEIDMEIIEVYPNSILKENKCLSCEALMKNEMLHVSYTVDNMGTIKYNKLPILKCTKCDKRYIKNTIFFSYTRNKELADINVKFKENDNEKY